MDIAPSIQGSEAFASGGYLGVVVAALLYLVVSALISELLVLFAKRAYHITRDGDKVGSIIPVAIRVAVGVMCFYMICKNCFDIELSVLIGALGIGGVALSLGMQDTIKNLLGGFQITLSHEISLGDWIRAGSVEGAVVDVNLRHTTLVDDIGQTHVIPNSLLNSNTFTRMPEYFRVPLTITLSRDVDFAVESPQICAVADKAMASNDLAFPEKKSLLVVNGVSAEGAVATLVVYARWSCSGAQVKDAVMAQVLAYLQQRGIIAHWS